LKTIFAKYSNGILHNVINSKIQIKMEKAKKKQMSPIVVDHGVKQILVKEFKTSFYYVNIALDGKKLTPTTLAIRLRAREMGGISADSINE